MYIPPSQYTTGFYSSKEYITSEDEIYEGPFYKLKNGKSFTGEAPNTDIPGTGIQIFKINIQTNTSNTSIPLDAQNQSQKNHIYIEEANNVGISLNQNREIVTPYNPVLTQDDIQKGTFQRYFSKTNNQLTYTEIDSKQYDEILSNLPSIAWDLYSVAELTWQIKGEIFNVTKHNKHEINKIEQPNSSLYPDGQDWKNFSKYFKENYLQFYQNIQENLYTFGNEYKLKDGKEYIGSYHIHPEKGPMVGSIHVSTPHDYLFPINQNNLTPTTGSTIPITQTQPSQPTYIPPSTGGSYSGGGGGY